MLTHYKKLYMQYICLLNRVCKRGQCSCTIDNNVQKDLKKLRINLTFQEEVTGQSGPSATIQIPLTTVTDKNGKNIVYVFEGEQPQEQEGELCAQVGDYVVIEKGLVDGEKILVESDSFPVFN